MVIGAGCDLGQMGHGQHLPVLAQLVHQPAHGFGHGAADTRIHFVEDQRRGFAEFTGGDGDGQRDA
ncbi:hypothetical protein D3C86_2082020 [compost metagenome]